MSKPMKQFVFWLSLYSYSVAASATANIEKPFLFPSAGKYTVEYAAPADAAASKAAQACFFQQNIKAHLDHVSSSIIPQAEQDIAQFLIPQTASGQTFNVAEDIDYGDLYHFHLAYGLDQNLSAENFLSRKSYHLLFHSFEHIEVVKEKWLRNLLGMNNAELNPWIEERLKAMNAAGGSNAADSGVGLPQLTVFSRQILQQIAVQWDRHIAAQGLVTSPGVERLLLRLRVLNDKFKDMAALKELLGYRNVASFENFYYVMPQGDVKNAWRPVDLFFDRAQGVLNSEIAKELRSHLQKTGQAWLVNPESKLAPRFTMSEKEKANGLEVYKKIYKLISTDENKYSILKKHILMQKKAVIAVTATENYIYMIGYNVTPSASCP